MEIIETYFNSTANEDNKDKQLTMCNISESLSLDSSNEKGSTQKSILTEKHVTIVDSEMMMHVLDLLCTLLKKTGPDTEEFRKIIAVFPQLLTFVQKSDDMFLHLHGTTALKNFIFCGHKEILKIVEVEKIIDVAKKLLSPMTNEQAALCLGNLII